MIDVYPDEVAGTPALGGYQLMVSADIFRGRYREGMELAKPIVADKPLQYRFALPASNHVSLPDHRIMAQIQSSWFAPIRPQSADFVSNMLGSAGGLQKGDSANLPYTRAGKLHRTAAGATQ